MDRHDEIEMKWRLDAAGHEALRVRLTESLGRPRRLEQHSLFFDTTEQVLRRSWSSLRVRRENDRVRVTCKRRTAAADGGLHRYDEFEQWIHPLSWPVLRDGADPRSFLPLPPALARLVRGRPLLCLGGFANLRLAFRSGRDELCLDRTDLPGGRRDFELELETPDPATTVPLWRRRLDAWGITRVPQGETKFQRFLATTAAQAATGDPGPPLRRPVARLG